MIKFKTFNASATFKTGKKTKWLGDDEWEWKYPNQQFDLTDFYNDIANFINSVEFVSLNNSNDMRYFIVWYKE